MTWVFYICALFSLIYALFSLLIAFTALNAGWQASVSALGTSFLAFFAGLGLRGSLYRTRGQKLVGLGLAAVLMPIAHWVGQGFSAQVFGYSFNGSVWGWLGFAISFICTTKRFAD